MADDEITKRIVRSIMRQLNAGDVSLMEFFSEVRQSAMEVVDRIERGEVDNGLSIAKGLCDALELLEDMFSQRIAEYDVEEQDPS